MKCFNCKHLGFQTGYCEPDENPYRCNINGCEILPQEQCSFEEGESEVSIASAEYEKLYGA